jgi:hypothetical protein
VEEGYAESHLGKQWMIDHPETITHWPPQYIVGKQVAEEKQVIAEYEDDFCKIELFAVDCEWNYSNPTGIFNLSLPHVLTRLANYTNVSYQ